MESEGLKGNIRSLPMDEENKFKNRAGTMQPVHQKGEKMKIVEAAEVRERLTMPVCIELYAGGVLSP